MVVTIRRPRARISRFQSGRGLATREPTRDRFLRVECGGRRRVSLVAAFPRICSRGIIAAGGRRRYCGASG